MGAGIATGVTGMAFPSAHEGSERRVRHSLTLLLREQSGLGASLFSWRPGVNFLGVPGGARRPLAAFSLHSVTGVSVLSLLSVSSASRSLRALELLMQVYAPQPCGGSACGLRPPSGGALDHATVRHVGRAVTPPAAAFVGPFFAPLRALRFGVRGSYPRGA